MHTKPFEAALSFVLRWEGGFVDHPADPGGRTNCGVTQKTYDAWRAGRGLPRRDVKLIDDADVHAVYESGYWIPPRCDLLDRPLDLVHLDTAVNMGPGRAVRFLQQAVGCAVDGDFGPATQRAVLACRASDTLAGYCNLRENFYRQIVSRKPEQSVFLKGWMNRLNSLRLEVGLPGAPAARGFEVGAVGATRRIPDIGEDPSFDF